MTLRDPAYGKCGLKRKLGAFSFVRDRVALDWVQSTVLSSRVGARRDLAKILLCCVFVVAFHVALHGHMAQSMLDEYPLCDSYLCI